MDRETNRPEVGVNVESGSEVRRGMAMARDLGVTQTHPEAVENMAVTRREKVEPFGWDLVHWGSIWGGFFTYLALVTILGAWGISAGAISASPANAPSAGTAGQIGVGVAIVMLVATFGGAVLAGWTSNLRSRWPAVVNGLIYASLVLTAPILFTLMVGAMTASATAGAVAQVTAARGGVYTLNILGLDANTMGAIASNVGWFGLGAILLLAVGALGYYLGMRLHLRDLGFIGRRT